MANPERSTNPDRPSRHDHARRVAETQVNEVTQAQPDANFPSTPLYLLAAFSLILPWFGVWLILWGGYLLFSQLPSDGKLGWMLTASGVACIVIDICIDTVWAHPSLSASAEPTLNRPGAELVGRLATVSEPIANGRGKVFIGDSAWMAEGDDAAPGEIVRVTGTRDTVLQVMRLHDPDA